MEFHAEVGAEAERLRNWIVQALVPQILPDLLLSGAELVRMSMTDPAGYESYCGKWIDGEFDHRYLYIGGRSPAANRIVRTT